MKENRIRWGVMGCGKIAHKFCEDLALSCSGYLAACASTSPARAQEFAVRHGAIRHYADYASLAADSDIDVIYIATPHSLHYDNTMLCLQHGKHVLVEKPAAINAQQFAGMTALATIKKCLLTEAMWTAYLPVMLRLKEAINAGAIGAVRHIDADFGFISTFDPGSRLFDPYLAGGSLLDIGIYPLFISLYILGKPKTIQSTVSHALTGVDNECTALLTFESGATASIYSSLLVHSDTKCEIYGTNGKITIPGRFHEQDHFFITDEKGDTGRIDCGKTGRGYFHEIEHVNDLLVNQRTDSDLMPHRLSMALLEAMDEIRHQNGIIYPAELGD